MIAPTIDLYDRTAGALSVPPLGDTIYPYQTASARQTAGVSESWASKLPVVLDGDGTTTQADIASAAASAAGAIVTSAAPKGFVEKLVDHTLLAVVGIVILAIGLFVLVKE